MPNEVPKLDPHRLSGEDLLELLAQAERIVRGDTLILPERAHLVALLGQRDAMQAVVRDLAGVLIAAMLNGVPPRARTLTVPRAVVDRNAREGFDVAIVLERDSYIAQLQIPAQLANHRPH
jgi:hypothetical protein